ncbi:MAG: hypothetical protein R2748_17440 [Bryobacterales bacterium]
MFGNGVEDREVRQRLPFLAIGVLGIWFEDAVVVLGVEGRHPNDLAAAAGDLGHASTARGFMPPTLRLSAIPPKASTSRTICETRYAIDAVS